MGPPMRLPIVLTLLSLSCFSAHATELEPSNAPVARAHLVPRTAIDGPAFTFDFPGLKVGVAEYDEGPTGTTVFLFPTNSIAAVDVRGGAPGTLMTDMVRLSYDANI